MKTQHRLRVKPGFFPAFCCALLISASALSAAAQAADATHPEAQLSNAFDLAVAGELEAAATALGLLLEQQPKFRAAQLLLAEVFQAQAGVVPDWSADKEPKARALRNEIRLRWEHSDSDKIAGPAFGHAPKGSPALAGYSDKIALLGRTPEVLLQTSYRYDRVLLVDTSEHRLYVIDPRPQQLGERPKLLSDYYVSIGSKGVGKEQRGDQRTPLGIYTIVSSMNDDQLPELYGSGAFPIDYPNSWDQRNERSGSGIWLHGVPRTTYARAPESSRGCVAMANDDLNQLTPHITTGNTQIIIADQINWLSDSEYRQRRQQLTVALEQWRSDWQNGSLERYMRHYAADFSDGESMSRARWQQQRAALVDSERLVKVAVSDVSILGYPGETDLVEIRFQLRYSSKTHSAQRRKRQYWRKTGGVWQIVQEESDNGVTGMELASHSP